MTCPDLSEVHLTSTSRNTTMWAGLVVLLISFVGLLYIYLKLVKWTFWNKYKAGLFFAHWRKCLLFTFLLNHSLSNNLFALLPKSFWLILIPRIKYLLGVKKQALCYSILRRFWSPLFPLDPCRQSSPRARVYATAWHGRLTNAEELLSPWPTTSTTQWSTFTIRRLQSKSWSKVRLRISKIW